MQNSYSPICILLAFEYKAAFVCWFEFDAWSFCPAPLIYLAFLFIFCCTTWLPFPVLVNSRCIFKWKYVSVDLLPWIFGITVISSHSIAFLCNNWDIKMVSSSCYELILKHKKMELQAIYRSNATDEEYRITKFVLALDLSTN